MNTNVGIYYLFEDILPQLILSVQFLLINGLAQARYIKTDILESLGLGIQSGLHLGEIGDLRSEQRVQQVDCLLLCLSLQLPLHWIIGV